eukprot:NODE_2383_length_1434_cov_121.401983_g2266_i0.p1 GENE.NODE_2383_length_1434_cov_121.401983_g2266_i0~~NODE_2383_length_1434_cov_121.401983_g2266_i0.p1  ORF type:complete len:394 (+),score=93.37 NODE_2383_length_1434_cov_121.401983_g2266_i0:66-1247(+)
MNSKDQTFVCPASGTAANPLLFTPGPITTAPETKAALLRDWGSRDPEFIALNKVYMDYVLKVAGDTSKEFVCVPVQGSGTFANEAMLGTLIPNPRKTEGAEALTLVVHNGSYGTRLRDILKQMGYPVVEKEHSYETSLGKEHIAEAIAQYPKCTHVAVVHCETSGGVENDLVGMHAACQESGKRLLVDSISGFGAMEINVAALPALDAFACSVNKCFEGVPGFAFVVTRASTLEASKGNSPSLVLDLHDQLAFMHKNGGQWRFTPPCHVVAGFCKALELHQQEGGSAARYARYKANCTTLIKGMSELGLKTHFPADFPHQAALIVSFTQPVENANWDFNTFYEGLKEGGVIIYPGKIPGAHTFRVGCIGWMTPEDVTAGCEVARKVLQKMKIL